MSDREHPFKHDDTGARIQPLSPKNRGIDPLTEGGKLFDRRHASRVPAPSKGKTAKRSK